VREALVWPQPSDRKNNLAILHVAFGDDSVCVSEVGGGTRCFDLQNGLERWAWAGGSSEHVTRLGYNVRAGRYYGIVHVIASGEKALMKLDGDGTHERFALGTPVDTEFCLDSEVLILSDGRAIATASGKLLRRLELVSG
jgi:hypothetical protein